MKRALLIASGIALSVFAYGQLDCNQSSSSAELDVNNVRAMLLNAGDMFWDQPGTGNARYEVPKADDPNQVRKNSLFAAALWMGGRDAATNDVLVTAQTYRQSHYAYWPGPIDRTPLSNDPLSITQEECNFWNKHFKVDRDRIDQFQQDFYDGSIVTAQDIPDQLRYWPGKNNPHIDPYEGLHKVNLDRDLAPFIDANGDGNYNPMDGDYPDIMGDQSVWWIMNDIGNLKQFGGNLMTQNDNIGLEIAVEAFAFKTNDHMNNITFQKYTITNKGDRMLEDTYAGIWVDTDLGNFVDDYVGCDTTRGLAYSYNGDDNDDGVTGYGTNVPAIGVSVCKGIDATQDGRDNDGDGQIDEPYEELRMTNFMTYFNNSDPTCAGNPHNKEKFFHYLRNNWTSTHHVAEDGASGCDQNEPKTDYMFSGSPINGTGWTEANASISPGDRRFLMSMGPFTLTPGKTVEFTVAIPWAQSNQGALAALQELFHVTDRVRQQCVYDFPQYLSKQEKIPQIRYADVYPTRVDNLLTVDMQREGKVHFSLFSLTGKLVAEVEIDQTENVWVGGLPAGMYTYRIQGQKGVQTGKIVKQ